jgi:hypothetical protein
LGSFSNQPANFAGRPIDASSAIVVRSPTSGAPWKESLNRFFAKRTCLRCACSSSDPKLPQYVHYITIIVGLTAGYGPNPGDAEKRCLNITTTDGKRIRIEFGEAPGQPARGQALHLVRALSAFTVAPTTESGDKLTRFGPFSSQRVAGSVKIPARPVERGSVPRLRRLLCNDNYHVRSYCRTRGCSRTIEHCLTKSALVASSHSARA